MFLTDLSIKRPVVASVMSLVLVIFGLVTFQEIPTDELPDVQPPVVTIQTEYRGASAEIIDTQITQKIEDFVGGTPGLETIDSFSEDESSRITLTFQTDLNLDDVANDVRSSVARVLDNLPDGAEQPGRLLPRRRRRGKGLRAIHGVVNRGGRAEQRGGAVRPG